MKNIVVFAALCGLCWGLYGDSLARARTALSSPWKPYTMIGFAYLVWGVLGGLAGMKMKGEAMSFSGPGALWGFIAGSLGAWGALFLTLSMVSGGARNPHLVMPVVFGTAVTVAALVGWLQSHGKSTNPALWVGMIFILTGILLVTYYTPHKVPPAKAPAQVAVTAH